MIAREGQVDYSRAATTNWVSATNAQRLVVYERLRTLERSSAAVQLQDLSVIRLRALSLMTLLPPQKTTSKARLDLLRGWLYFFHRNERREIEVHTPSVVAGIEGTEFNLEVDANGRTVLTLIDGKVEMSNPFGTLALASGEQGIAEPGQPPRKAVGINTLNVIQWTLYYPGVLDADDLDLTPAERTALGPSIEAYRRGDLRSANDTLPAGNPASPAARTYYSAVRLSSGKETNYEAFAASLDVTDPNAAALRWLLAAVTQRIEPPTATATNASQLVGLSYYLQSRFKLTEALEAASRAVKISSRFGFGWERVAELELSFGRLEPAEAALDRALELSPANAQAHALKGFLLLGRDNVESASKAFDEAIRLDDRLGNGWLGRGLCRIRGDQPHAARADLQTAAAMEPNRSLLRSYLGKAYDTASERATDPALKRHLAELAEKELVLARELDQNDPTPWFYSALLKRQVNRNNEAIRDLERSVALNDNRQVYRSRLLLDQDRAVRSANLARIYAGAGFTEFSLQEAARSVNAEYANYSAHLFLAESYNNFRDPNRVNLRDETAWSNERFLANLLAPVGASPLSQNISQQEYSSLFRTPDFGLSSVTEIYGNGDFRETASHFGTVGNVSYSLDPEYFNVDGFYPNTDLSRFEWYSQVKLQLTPRDSVFVQTKYQDLKSGDIIQYYDPSQIRPNFRFSEAQEPLLFVGYDHKWSEGVHTLFLGSRLINDLRYRDLAVPGMVLTRLGNDIVDASVAPLYDIDYRSEFETYTAELTQLFQAGHHTFVFGGRINSGRFTTRNVLTNLETYYPGASPYMYPTGEDQETELWRGSAYAYDIWQVTPRLFLTAGVAYDRLDYPENFRNVPISTEQADEERVSPKGALHWTPVDSVTIRGVYSRSLGGVSFDESVRLEP
ncbi:MAG: FecR domain-containing protein, partial [Verrucomicrobia subdivision 3 bacterium]|nr:FecR domain-containing protein [Limisphaerales bacterium]